MLKGHLLFLAGFFSLACFPQSYLTDSLKQLVQAASHDTMKATYMNELSWQLMQIGEWHQSQKYLDTVLALSEKNKFPRGEALAYDILGLIQYNKGNNAAALDYFYKMLKISEENGFKRYIMYAHGNIGNVLISQGHYDDALKSQEKALHYSIELGYKQGIANSYVNIGNCYLHKKNYDKVLENYELGLKILYELRDSVGIAVVLGNTGELYLIRGSEPGTSPEEKTKALHAAREKYEQALQLNKAFGNQEGIAQSYLHISGIKVRQGLYKEAEELIRMAHEIALTLGSKDQLKSIYLRRYELDTITGNHKSAFENYKLFILYSDSLVNEENTRKIVQSQMQYEFDKQEAEDKAEREKQEAVAEEERQQQKIILYSVSAGLVIVIAIALFILRSYREKRRANIEITRQKQIIEEKQKEILDSIHYAKRIQRSLLPSDKYIERSLKKN